MVVVSSFSTLLRNVTFQNKTRCVSLLRAGVNSMKFSTVPDPQEITIHVFYAYAKQPLPLTARVGETLKDVAQNNIQLGSSLECACDGASLYPQ